MHVDSGSAISVLVCRNIFVGTPPKLKEAAGHLSKVRLKFAQIKLWHIDISGGEDPVRLPEHCRQGPTGSSFQLRDGSGSGIRKNISGRIGYGSGTGICILYLINRVLSGSENIDRVFFGYLLTSY